jgi:hypothetical protein
MKLVNKQLIWLLAAVAAAAIASAIYVLNKDRVPTDAELRAIYNPAPDNPAVTKILIGLQVPGTAGYEAKSDAAAALLQQLAQKATREKHQVKGKPAQYVVQVIHDQAYEGGAQYAATRLVELKAAAVLGPALPKLNATAKGIYLGAGIQNYPFDLSSTDFEKQLQLAFETAVRDSSKAGH